MPDPVLRIENILYVKTVYESNYPDGNHSEPTFSSISRNDIFPIYLSLQIPTEVI